jgi:REP element-mobilizing transposase RayT
MRDRLFVHIVWTTRGRAALIDARVAQFLAHALPITRQERGRVLAIGIVANHVHMLARVCPMTLLPRPLQRLKGGTAMVANRDGHADRPLRWDKGYNIESVSRMALKKVRDYVKNQPRHHPAHAIPGFPAPRRVASATSAEPRL